jgi:cation diffusion facilitator family transporter
MDMKKYKTPVAVLSVVSNTILVVLKCIVGLSIGSISVISEAIHSAIDLLAAIIALFAVRKSIKPPDKEHSFGHGKVENISGTIEAILIFLAAGFIINESIHKLRQPEQLDTVGWGILVMLFSAVANIIVSHLLFKVSRATDSIALEADAWHLRTDVYTSFGVFGALIVIWTANLIWPSVNLAWIDPVAALVVALLIIHAAYRLVVKSARDILDSSLDESEVSEIRKIIMGQSPRVISFHNLRTRKASATRFIEVHIVVEHTLSAQDSHEISRSIKDEIRSLFPDTQIIIQVEPCDRPQLER